MGGLIKGRDRDAVSIMKVTGAGYMVSLNEVLRRRSTREVKFYMMGIRSMPMWQIPLALKCVRCLAPEHGKCDR